MTNTRSLRLSEQAITHSIPRFIFRVKLGVDENGRYVAIKRYKKETASLKTLKHELGIMKVLDHENLVKLIDVRENATYKSRHENTYQCFAIIL